MVYQRRGHPPTRQGDFCAPCPAENPFAPGAGAEHGCRFMSENPPDISHDQHAVRRQKLAEMRAAGFDPFRASVATTHFSTEAKALYVDGQDYAQTVTVAGRLVTFRAQGGSSFVKIQDQQGQIQLYFKKDVLGEERYGVFKKSLDLGDIIGVTGALFRTKTGEVTVRVDAFTLLSKSLRPLPEK